MFMKRIVFFLPFLVLGYLNAGQPVYQEADFNGNDSIGIQSERTTQEVFSYTGIDGESHEIEVHFPDKQKFPGKRPAAVFFHGGGWHSGNLPQFSGICNYLASRGMVALTANYSMYTKEEEMNLEPGVSRKTICVIDGKTVIRWTKQHATDLGIDPTQIVAGGASAGGHIAVLSMIAPEHNNPADPMEFTTDVKAFLLFCPAFTIRKNDKAPEVNVFNYSYISYPPSLFLVGEKDPWEAASHVLADSLTKSDNDFEYWMAMDEGHMFFRKENWVDICIKKMDEFLVTHDILDRKSLIEDSLNSEDLRLITFTNSMNQSTRKERL